MADVNKPESSSEALQTTSSPSVNGAVPIGTRVPGGAEEHGAETPLLPRLGELLLLLRWLAGLALVMVCGWGLIVLALFVTRHYNQDSTLAVCLSLVVSLLFFLGVEYKHWLTRLMGLRPFGSDPYGVKSALFFWLAGVPGILMFRTATTTEAEAEADAAPRPAAQAEMQPQPDGVREIVETIVFVVVLVLLLKSFAAEAFVIPTGSMAETLYGYQRIIKCPECGLEFPVNCSSEVDPQYGAPVPIESCICPSCRYPIDFQNEEKINPGWKKPDWNSGDRVLVAKFLYELFNKRPNRLDVVVFKYPGDSHYGSKLFPASGPMKNYTPMNYIKRLIGLPGETIAIHRGKLYVLPPGSGIEYDDWAQAQTDEELRIKLWQWEHMHVNDPKALELFGEEKFSIVRKPPETMLSVRRLVFDNDHQAKDMKDVLPPRWAGDNWKEDGSTFKIDGGDARQWLRYRHYLRTFQTNKDAITGQAPARSLITDFMGYNFYLPHITGALPGENWVGDLMIECEVVVDKPEGEIVLELSKSHNRFRLVWNLSTGDMDLKKDETILGSRSKVAQPKKGSTYRLRFADFDDRLTVWLDNSLPFDEGVTYKGSKDQFAGPLAENDLEPASIGVKGASVTIRKLSLWRDTYYTAGESPTNADATGFVDLSKPDTWESLRHGMPIKTLYVQPDHFLCLGDNSPESSDGRSWGLVPERLLLGRAMLVYYPFGRAERIR